MPAIPLKSEYGPTLGELLAPRWRGASRAWRAIALATGVALIAVLVAAFARFEHPTLSYRGLVSFSFRYGGLYRTSPEAGGYVRVRRVQDGQLQDSFAVAPLLVPVYRGRPSAALALYATGYIRRLAQRYAGFSLRGEGWTQVDSISPYAVYNVFYTARVAGREMYGRDVLLLHERLAQRRGVAISMLSEVAANRQVSSPLLIGTKGALEAPLTSFALE
ncbi:MAG TPA: hypothetical protein VGL37_00690 [Solirubrobacteraceae bacterium]|jgi:hypothetical protein